MVAHLDNSTVDGVPPVATTTPPPSPEKSAVELSGGLVQLAGKNTHFSVDYRFTAGKPDPENLPTVGHIDAGKAAKTMTKPIEVKGDKFAFKDTLVKDLVLAVKQGSKFEMWVTEDAGGDSQGTSISNKLTGTVGVSLDVAAGDASVSSQCPGCHQRGRKGKGQKGMPQQFTVQVQWTLKAGQLNPQATYSCIMVVQGGTAVLAGRQTHFRCRARPLKLIPMQDRCRTKLTSWNSFRPGADHGVERA